LTARAARRAIVVIVDIVIVAVGSPLSNVLQRVGSEDSPSARRRTIEAG